jgi:hypothetical protein
MVSIGIFIAGMIFAFFVFALFDSDDREGALEIALKNANGERNEAIDLADRAVAAYKLLAEEYEHLEMIREHLEERLIIQEVLSEFE